MLQGYVGVPLDDENVLRHLYVMRLRCMRFA